MTTPAKVAGILGIYAAGLLAVVIALSGMAQAAAPQITAVTLTSDDGNAVNVAANNYLVVPNQTWGSTGTSAIFIMPGASSGNTTTSAPSFVATATTYFSDASPMFGTAGGWGMMLLQFTSSDLGATMMTNLPTNANTVILGGAQGPLNKDRISLTSAIPVGTTVKFTLNMKGEIPQLVAVLGGSFPTITYDSALNSGEGALTIQTKTFSTTTNASDSLTGMVGFFLTSDTSLGTTPLRIITQTNAWVGDLFAFMPGLDSSCAVGVGGAGTAGTSSARFGATIYGITGQSRNVSIFIPDASLASLYGATATSDQLDSLVNGSSQSGDTVTNTSNFAVSATTDVRLSGKRFDFTYTFASPKDASIGIPSGSSSAVFSGVGGGICFLDSAAGEGPGGGMGKEGIALLAGLCAVLGALAYRRRLRRPSPR